jgi:hypothetical protein
MGLMMNAKQKTDIQKLVEVAPESFNGFLWGWKAVEGDLSSTNGYRYKLGDWNVASNPIKENTDACPTSGTDGDGLCIARNFYGAAQGGRSCRTILICAYLQADILGQDDSKLRVSKLFVPDWGLWSIEVLARGACLRGADLDSRMLDIPAGGATGGCGADTLPGVWITCRPPFGSMVPVAGGTAIGK